MIVSNVSKATQPYMYMYLLSPQIFKEYSFGKEMRKWVNSQIQLVEV